MRRNREPAPDAWLDDVEDTALELGPYLLGLGFTVLAVSLAVAVVAMQPAWLTGLLNSLSGAEPKVFWYLSRSSALVSYGLLWVSMVLGLAITNKWARAWPGGPTYAALHEHTSWLGLVLAGFHGLVLLGDQYIGYSLNQILVPFASTGYRPLWVAAGQIGMYLLILVTLSFYVRRWIGQAAWRLIHYFSFAVFGLALVHGLLSGTDSSSLWVLLMYWLTGMSVVILTVYRVGWRHARAGRAHAHPEAAL